MSFAHLHDPSGAAASTSATPEFAPSPVPTIQSEAVRLTSLKDNITSRLDVYYDVLRTNDVTMATSLIDPEGFPRSDLDVASIRTARSQINRLRNDLKGVMLEMGSLLERGLPRGEEPSEGKVNGNGAMEVDEEEENEQGSNKEFARVAGVFPSSPADIAGLKREDLIISFGEVTAENHDNLQGVAGLVGRSEGVSLPLVISRLNAVGEKQTLHLRLTPKTGWGGRGLLGCHIVPV